MKQVGNNKTASKMLRLEPNVKKSLEDKAAYLGISFTELLTTAALEYPCEEVMAKRIIALSILELKEIIRSLHNKECSEEEKESLNVMEERMVRIWKRTI